MRDDQRLAAIRARVALGRTHRTATPYSEPGAVSLQTQLADDGAWLLERLDAAEATISALRAACYEEVPEGVFSFSGMTCRLCGYDVSPDCTEEHEPSCVLFDDGGALSPAADPGSGGGK